MAKYEIKEPANFDNYEQLARISFNLRHFSKIWKEHYGSFNRKNMGYWERKLDEWIKNNIQLCLDEEKDEEKVFNIDETWQNPPPKLKQGDLSEKNTIARE